MSNAEKHDGATTVEDVRKPAWRLGLDVFLPGIVFSVFAGYVGLANWEVEGPGFFAWSVVALIGSIWCFIAVRRQNAHVVLFSGVALILIGTAFTVFLVWTRFTVNPVPLNAFMYALVVIVFGATLVENGAVLFRQRAREREAAEMRNPYAELGSTPENAEARRG